MTPDETRLTHRVTKGVRTLVTNFASEFRVTPVVTRQRTRRMAHLTPRVTQPTTHMTVSVTSLTVRLING